MSESELIDFLSTGASYGKAGQSVARIETHCSIVFLVGGKAYKLKRPIAFSALDYTTLEQREAACRREVELNRRTAPELYLGVRAIRRAKDGRLAFDGVGPVVDWVVVMRRFEQSGLFDHLADENRLTTPLIRELADEIVRFHAVAQVTRSFGGAQGIRNAIERNRRDQLTVEPLLRRDAIERVYASSLAHLDGAAALLDRRRESGRVRLCHGDLRLANICLYRGRPTLFDAIDFADEPVCIDVLYDLAFLLMDLDQRGLGVPANLVFNRYFDATGDAGGLPTLPLMISVRASTRAYAVAASSLRRPDPAESRRLASAAQALMASAATLLEPASPRLIAIAGGMESDRIALAEALAPCFRPAPGARIAPVPGPGAASPSADSGAIVAAGYTAILVGPADTDRQRQVAELAEAEQVPCLGLWLGDGRDAPPAWHTIDPGRGTAAVKDLAPVLNESARSGPSATTLSRS
ncbi:MAG TPA: phosphotransferase [Stellaceae bacterium]|nr:phosphotransferase [Stellaceae bacterium]